MLEPSKEATVRHDVKQAQPLAGIHVLELASIGPVPFAGRILQQMGAGITVVLPPQDRKIGLPVPAKYDYLSQGKSEVRVDLKAPDGLDHLLGLVEGSGVLLEGFRPGTLERLGLSPSELHARNPNLIIGRCGGWGRQSLRAAEAGHDINYLALSGALAAIGDRGPLPPLNLVGDFGGGAMHLVAGVLAALVQRQSDPRGTVVETSIHEGTMSLMSMIYGLVDAGQWQGARQANVLDGGAPYYRCYQTADDRWMAVGAIEAKFFKEFIARINADVDIERQNDRTYWPVLKKEISARMREKTRDEWSVVFMGTDACCTPVLELDECRRHPDTSGYFLDGAPKPAVKFS